MENFLHRVAYTLVASAVSTAVLVGLGMIVRRIQIACGMKDDTADKPVPVSSAR